jgi:UDP-GlcNAc:undecaprenyl-phosphate GlcNAc-1-phosphate transferase
MLAAAMAGLLLLLAKRLAVGAGIVATPNPVVSDHVKPIPLLGGTAVFLAFLLISVLDIASQQGILTAWDRGLLVGVGGFVVLGTIDDWRSLSPTTKLAGQVVVCVLALATHGEYTLVALIGATAFLVIVVNAFNLVDVMDGLLCAISGPALFALLLIPGLLSERSAFHLWLALACVITLFLFNRPPASIYSGDAGSLTIGFLLGYVWLELVRTDGIAAAAPALLLFAVPLSEVALLVAARVRRGLSPFRASPDHFSLRLRDQQGWSRAKILCVSFGVVVALAIAPAVTYSAPLPIAVTYVVACGIGLAILFQLCWQSHPPVS